MANVNETLFNLTLNGQILQILEVLDDVFNNTRIQCRAILDGNPYHSTSDAILTVIPSTTVAPVATTVSTAPSVKNPASSSDNTVIVIVMVIVGGALVIVIVLLACYLTKAKLRAKRPRAEQNPSRDRRLNDTDSRLAGTMALAESSPTYEDIPAGRGEATYHEPQHAGQESGHTGHTNENVAYQEYTESGADVYALPNKTYRTQIRHYTPNNDDSAGRGGFNPSPNPHGGAPSTTDGQQGAGIGNVIYAECRKSRCSQGQSSAIDKSDEEGAEREDVGQVRPNAEGLVYADLDLERPPATGTERVPNTGEQTLYSEIRRDV